MDFATRKNQSIAFSLAALVLVATLPLLVFGSGVAWLIAEQKKDAVATQLLSTAGALRVAVDHELTSQFAAMAVVANSASLDSGDLDSFRDRARRSIEAHGRWLNVGLIDARSRLIVADVGPPIAAPKPTLAPAAVDRVVQTRKPAIGGAFSSGRITAKPIILLMVPLIRQNHLRYVLAVALDAAVLSDVFREQGLPASWTGAVIDEGMTIAGRSRDAERYIGMQATPSLADGIRRSASGMFLALNQEGARVYTVFDRSPQTGWSVSIGVPAEEVEGPTRAWLWRLAAAAAVLIAFALALSTRVGRAIAREREAYEASLREKERKYRLLFESANDGIFLTGPQGFIDCNKRGAAMYGRPADEVIGHSPDELSPERQPDGRLSAEVAAEKIRLAMQGQPVQFEWQSLRADGTPFDVEITLNRIDLDELTCVQAIVRDITERKQSARALQQAHDLLARLAAQVPGVIFQYQVFPDGHACVPYASRGVVDMYELDPDDLRADAQPVLDRTHPDDYEALIESIRAAARKLQRWRHEYRVVLPRQGERWRLGHAQPERLPDGSILFHGFVMDITERKAAQARDYLLVTALEAVANGVVITDRHARIEWANRAFEVLSGYTREEAIGRCPAELVKSGMQTGDFYAAMWQTILDGRQWRGELVNRRKDGRLYDEELVIAPVKDASGKIAHFVAIKQDISARKRMESDLREMATTDALSDLPNRRHFMARLEEELARCQRLEHQRAAVLMIDLDYFKRINDTHGHAIGDAVLRHFAALLREGLRKIDAAGRIGGEEFAVILPGADLAAADAFAERLRRKVEATPLRQNGQTVPVTISVGIAAVEPADASPDAALARADEALYRAKEQGRNCVATAG